MLALLESLWFILCVLSFLEDNYQEQALGTEQLMTLRPQAQRAVVSHKSFPRHRFTIRMTKVAIAYE